MSLILGTALVRIQPSMLGFGAALSAGLAGPVARAMTTIGSAASLAITAPIVAGIGIALNEAVKFESAFAGVKKTVMATDGEFAILEQGIIDMANKMPFAREEIAKVMEAAGRFGVPTENLLGFTEVALKLGTATGMGAGGAAEALTKLGNIMHLPTEGFDNLAAAVVALGNDFPTTEANILNFSNRLAGAGQVIGLSAADVVGFSAGLASLGIRAEAGGTAFSRVFLKMNDAALEGGEKLGKFTDIMGMTEAEFQKAWKDDPAMAVMAFVKGIDNLNRSGVNTPKILSDLELGEIRVRDALLRSSSGYDTMARAMFTARAGYTENTALEIEYAKRAATTASQLTVLKNNFTAVALELGQALIPILISAIPSFKALAETLMGWVKAFTELSPHTQEFILKAVLIAAAVGPLILIIVKLGSAIIGIGKAFKALAVGLAANPWLLLAAAIAAAAVAIYLNWDKVVAFLQKAWASFRSTVEPIRAWFMTNVWPMMVDVWQAMQDVWDVVLPALQAVWTGIKAGWDAIVAASGWLIASLQSVWQWLKDLWTASEPLREMFVNALKVAIDSLVIAWNALWAGISVVIGWLQTLWERSEGVRAFLADVFRAAIDTLVTAWTTYWQIVSTVIDWVQALWDRTEGVREFLVGAFKVAVDVVVTILGALWTAIQTVWEWMQTLWDRTEGFRSMLAGAFKLALDVLIFQWELVTGAIRIVWNILQELWDRSESVRGFLVDVFWFALDMVRGAFNLLWEAIKAVWDVIQWLWDRFEGVRGFLAGVFMLGVDLARGAFNLLWEAIKAVWDVIQWLWDRSEGLRGFLAGAFTTAIGALGSIWDGIITAISTVVGWLQQLVNWAREGWSWLQKLSGSNPVVAVGDPTIGTPAGYPTVAPLPPQSDTRHSGGIVPNAYGNEVPMVLKSGERVLTEDQDKLLLERGLLDSRAQVVFTGDIHNDVDMDGAYRLAMFHLSSLGVSS